VTAKTLADIILAASNKRFWNSFYNSLSIIGVDGTLSKRLTNTPVKGNFYGKTGTHRTVSSLAGVMQTKNNEFLVVAMIFNEVSSGVSKSIENDICTKLYEF
jgi:D-alanyl-D-alanine carboxypeptidase/D-alanyl-D-alanine-endopeptidase (penicillin-binding protein 4)